MKIDPNAKIKILGIDLDMYTECMWCEKKRAVFDKVAYRQPCDSCRCTKRYEEYVKKKDQEDKKFSGMKDALRAGKAVAVWEGKGRQVTTDHRGNILDNVPAKPRPVGKKDWGKF